MLAVARQWLLESVTLLSFVFIFDRTNDTDWKKEKTEFPNVAKHLMKVDDCIRFFVEENACVMEHIFVRGFIIIIIMWLVQTKKVANLFLLLLTFYTLTTAAYITWPGNYKARTIEFLEATT